MDYFNSNYALWIIWLATGVAVVGGGLVLWRRIRHQRRNQYLRRLQISLTGLHSDVLQLRTLWEGNVAEILHSPTAVARLLKATRGTPTDNPFISLDSHEYRFFLQAAINRISSLTAVGHLERDQQLPVVVASYVLGWVREEAENLSGQKLRIIVVAQDVLENLPQNPPQYENPEHEVRWRTLTQMARHWRENPLRLGRVEVVLKR